MIWIRKIFERRRRNVTNRLFVAAVCSLGLMISCNESLPPYSDPAGILRGTIVGTYILAHQNNYMGIHVFITNVFDETLEAQATLTGQVRIQSLREADVIKTVSLSVANLATIRHYNSATTDLTIDPGDTVELTYAWQFIDDTGRNLVTSFFQFIQDTTCPFRCLAYTEEFALSGEITVFAGKPSIELKGSTFRLCYVTSHIDPAYCPPILYGQSCALFPSPHDQPCTLPERGVNNWIEGMRH
jgi:hypothetical protein